MTPTPPIGKQYNHITNEKLFDVQSLITAYHFPDRTSFEPFFEEYDFSQIIYVTSGTGIYTTQNSSYPFGPGMMFFRPAHQKSKYEWNTPQASFALISFVCPSDAMQCLERPPFLLCEEESATLLDLIRTGVRLFEPCKRPDVRGMKPKESASPAVLNYIFASLERFLIMVYCRLNQISYLIDESQKAGTHIDEAHTAGEIRDYLLEHITEQLTVRDICSRFWISPTTLNRKFQREYGRGVIDYFIEMKIQTAKSLIQSTPKSFTDISEHLGFSSVNYFSKVFKAKVGMTPTEYSRFASKRHTGV